MKIYKIVLFVIVFISCNKPKPILEQVSSVVSDSIKHQAVFNAQRFKIKDISKGVDQLCIRVWYSHSFSDHMKVVQLMKDSIGNWSAQMELVIFDTEKGRDSILEVRTERLQYQHMDDLYIRLHNLQIENLPDMYDIPGLEDRVLDGSSYNIEIATSQSYRYYGYHSPDSFKKKYWQADNVVQILETIEQELDVPWRSNRATNWIRDYNE